MAAAAESLANAPAEMQDHYSEHLADVNQDIDVVATEDIVNQKGVLIARKGTRWPGRVNGREINETLFKRVDLGEKLAINAMASVNFLTNRAGPEGSRFRRQPATGFVKDSQLVF